MAFFGRRQVDSGPGNEENPSKWKKSREKRTWKKDLPKVARDAEEIDRLNRLCENLSTFSNLDVFASFPISTYTLHGLSDCGYEKPTDIQKQTVGLALRGCDVLGAAKTGSGKTLAFMIPVLEQLYRNRWCKEDGLGALIITPVRELAYQIFEILKIVGKYHYFSAALVIGGQNLSYEKQRINVCNIIICTPGRLLQHMDENPLFDASNLKMLVLDEADRILDMGFSVAMNSIFDNLSTERQTLLFSATQTKLVKDLARASLKDPVYVSAHEHSAHSTPDSLMQGYVSCELHHKIDLLWSFLCHHQQKKILVFVTSCKQVTYIIRAFKRLKCRFTLHGIHGRMNQEKRLYVYEKYCQEEHGVLIATDVASRGLDFPAVDWVLQLDCPEDVKTYIHRVGRTARFDAHGKSLLVLMPSEKETMIGYLKEKNIPITEMRLDKTKQFSLKNKLSTLVAAEPELKEYAQRAFGVYMKSIFLMKDKKLFDVTKLDADAFSCCLGLIMQPKLRFIQKRMKIMDAAKAKRAAKLLEKVNLGDTSAKLSEEEKDEKSEESPKPASKLNPMYVYDTEQSSEDDDDLLILKRVLQPDELGRDFDDGKELEILKPKIKSKVITKPAKARKLINKKIKANTKITFNDDGEEVVDFPKRQTTQAAMDAEAAGEGEVPCGINLKLSAAIMMEEYQVDKRQFHKRVRALHKEEHMKQRELLREQYADRNTEDRQPPRLNMSDEETPDLSYLPDPDKLYGSKGGTESSTASSDNSSSDEEERNKKSSSSKKRKAKKPTRKFAPVQKKVRVCPSSDEDAEDSEYEPLDTEMTLHEDEELALRLLNK